MLCKNVMPNELPFCNSLIMKIGASEGIRTLDIHLGKVTLYQAELRSLPADPDKLPESGGNASLVLGKILVRARAKFFLRHIPATANTRRSTRNRARAAPNGPGPRPPEGADEPPNCRPSRPTAPPNSKSPASKCSPARAPARKPPPGAPAELGPPPPRRQAARPLPAAPPHRPGAPRTRRERQPRQHPKPRWLTLTFSYAKQLIDAWRGELVHSSAIATNRGL